MILDPKKGDFKGPLRKQQFFLFAFNSLECNYSSCRHYTQQTFPYFNGHIISNKWCQKAMEMQFNDSNFKDLDHYSRNIILSFFRGKSMENKGTRKLHEATNILRTSNSFGVVGFGVLYSETLHLRKQRSFYVSSYH